MDKIFLNVVYFKISCSPFNVEVVFLLVSDSNLKFLSSSHFMTPHCTNLFKKINIKKRNVAIISNPSIKNKQIVIKI